MKLLMYGVSKETVMKEDVIRYSLNDTKKERQMHTIANFAGVEEIIILSSSFRIEYYLYVNEEDFSHGEFLRYLAEETDKSLQEIILETYSKFNEDVLRHLFEITNGYFSDKNGLLSDCLESVERAVKFAHLQKTSDKILFHLFNRAIYLTYHLVTQDDFKPLNESKIAKYIYLMKINMETLNKKNIIISGAMDELYFLTKILILAEVQSITILQDENEDAKQLTALSSLLSNNDTKIYIADDKSLNYRLSKADAIIVDTSKTNILDLAIQEEVAIVRQTKKIQYLIDTSGISQKDIVTYDLDIRFIDGTAPLSFIEEEKNNVLVWLDEYLSNQVVEFMKCIEEEQHNLETEVFN